MSIETTALLKTLIEDNFGAFREGGLQILDYHICNAKEKLFNEAVESLGFSVSEKCDKPEDFEEKKEKPLSGKEPNCEDEDGCEDEETE